MIRIKPSPTADTRTCDHKNVTKEQLKEIKTAEEMILATRALEEGKLASFHMEKRKVQDLETALDDCERI